MHVLTSVYHHFLPIGPYSVVWWGPFIAIQQDASLLFSLIKGRWIVFVIKEIVEGSILFCIKPILLQVHTSTIESHRAFVQPRKHVIIGHFEVCVLLGKRCRSILGDHPICYSSVSFSIFGSINVNGSQIAL